MPAYVADVAVRWSDQDAYGHVNHARVVTLLEEARAGLVFDTAARGGVAAFETVVAALEVRYRRPIPWSTGGVRIEMVVEELRAASFRVRYRLLVAAEDGAGWDSAKPAAEATTQLVPYDLATTRTRRLTADERTFLTSFQAAAAYQAAGEAG